MKKAIEKLSEKGLLKALANIVTSLQLLKAKAIASLGSSYCEIFLEIRKMQ